MVFAALNVGRKKVRKSRRERKVSEDCSELMYPVIFQALAVLDYFSDKPKYRGNSVPKV